LAGLGVGGDSTGIVVTNHDDEPGTNDGEQRQKASASSLATAVVMCLDRSEGSTDLMFLRLFALHAPPPFVSLWSFGETTTQKPEAG
jgi:hypothetical protein